MKKPKIKAVCFDMWGTLMTGGGMKMWYDLQEIFSATNLEIREFITLGEKSVMIRPYTLKKGVTVFAHLINPKMTGSAINKAYNLWSFYLQKAIPYPETIGVLEKIHEMGVPLVIVSNTDMTAFNFVMKKFDIKKYFKKFFLSAQLGCLKPDLKIFRAAQDYLRLSKDQILMIDDSLLHGVLSAREFGWRALWVARGKPGIDPGKIENLDEIFNYLV